MRLEVFPVDGLPEIKAGDDLAALIAARTELRNRDIVVIAQKVVSKAENRFVDPADVKVGEKAQELAARSDKDPALVQLILDESREVLRVREGVIVVETRHGFVCANAGIDASNVPAGRLLLLPVDPDLSARQIRHGLQNATGRRLAVVVTDSFGRAWRSGQADVAIGCAGIAPLLDLRGDDDMVGRELAASVQAVGDELAGAADLARTKSSGQAVVIVRGRGDLVTGDDGPGAAAGLRERSQDLFR